MEFIKDVFTGLFTNGLWDFIKIFFKFLFGGVALGGLGFLGFKFYKNKNIKIEKSYIKDSFWGDSKNIDISKSQIKNSFK